MSQSRLWLGKKQAKKKQAKKKQAKNRSKTALKAGLSRP